MGVLFGFGLDDVVAEAGADEAGDLAGLLREGGLVEFRDGDAVLDPAELATLILAAGVVGVLLREIGEVLAVVLAELIEDALRFGFGGGVGVRSAVGVDGDEDVTHLRLRIDVILLLILVVVLLNLGLGDLRLAAGDVGVGDVDVLDLARLGIGILIFRGVLLVEGLEFGVGGVDGLAQVVGGEDGVLKLDLRILLQVRVADFRVRNDDAAGDEVAQAIGHDLLLDLGLELLDGHLQLIGDQLSVAGIADVLTVREQDLAELAGVQETPDVIIGGRDAEAARLFDQNVLLDHALAGLLHVDRHEHVGNLLAARHAADRLLDIDNGNGLLGRKEAAQEAAVPDGGISVRCGRGVVKDAGHQEDDHGDAGGADDDAEDPAGEASVFLQEANHAMGDSLFCSAGRLARGAERQMSCGQELLTV